MTARRLLLHAGGDLTSALSEVATHLAGAQNALFLPHALHDHDAYTAMVADRLAPLGVRLTGIHAARDPLESLAAADAIIVGGGNTFRLVRAVHELRLNDAIRARVAAGVPYFGSSAGANIAGASIRTTNDMPIVEPLSFAALSLVPFQINAHYVDPPPPEQRVGETREQRLFEFLEENDVVVVALRENSWLLVEADAMTLRGTAGAVVFRRGAEPQRISPGADLSHLLHEIPRFDA